MPNSALAKRILVADDEPAIRSLFAAAFRARGHAVVEAGSGRAACGALDSFRFDAVVLDLIMADGDGFAVIHRCMDGTSRPRIIAVSDKGNPVSDYLLCALTRGADLALVKSAPLASLVSAVEAVLGADAAELRKLRRTLWPAATPIHWPDALVRQPL